MQCYWKRRAEEYYARSDDMLETLAIHVIVLTDWGTLGQEPDGPAKK